MSMLRRVFECTAKPLYVGVRDAAIGVLERRHGIDTRDVVPLGELGLDAPGRHRYQAAAWFMLRRALPPSQVGAGESFCDVGCGKGRLVYQAARGYPFERVWGIDLSEELVAVARANVERTRHKLRCQDVRLEVADAATWEIPGDVTVLSLHNPFGGELFERFLSELLASLDRTPRRMRVLYINPREHDRLIATGRARVARVVPGYRPGREWARSNSAILYDVI